MAVRLPRVLKSDLTEAFRLRPVEMSITLNLREDSTATITLPDDAQDVPVRSFVELYTPNGSAGIFRVTDTSRNVFNQRVLTLKSGLATLEDSVYRVQEDYEGTVQAFLSAVLGYQTVTRWQLGTVADGSTAYKRSGINYNSLADLIRGLSDDDVDHYFETDYTTTPWTLHYRAVPTTVGCEMRLSRSVRTVQIVRNDAELCTRLYLSVSSDLVETELRTYNDEDAQAVYGIVEKTADVNAADVADPDAWAARYMREHKAPAVQITIDGYELARLTGDSWDEYSLGKLCRVNLSGELLEERVVSVTYPDPLGEPDLVQVQLATKAATASSAIASLVRKSGGGGGGVGVGGGYANYSDLRNIATKTSDNRTNIVKLIDKTGIDALHANETLHGKIVTNYDLIQGDEDNIRNIVEKTAIGRLATGETLYGKIEDQQDEIDKTGVSSLAEGETLYSRTANNASKIGSVPDGQNLYSLHSSNASAISSQGGTISTHTTQIGNLQQAVADQKDEIDKYADGTTPFQTIAITNSSFTVNTHPASWLSDYVLTGITVTMPSITLSTSRDFVWANGSMSNLRSTPGQIVTAYTAGSVTNKTGKTIYYLGRRVN